MDLCKSLKAQIPQQAHAIAAAHPYLLAAIWNHVRSPVLVICAQPDDSRSLYEELFTWCGEAAPLYHFPESEILPFERLIPDSATTHARMGLLGTLSNYGSSQLPPIIVASVHAIGQKTLAQQTFKQMTQTIQRGQQIKLTTLLNQWQSMGYEIEREVTIPGSMSHRGGILDIYPPHAKFPTRIELLGDKVESLRSFDPTSQRSLGTMEILELVPAQEILPSLAGTSKLEAFLNLPRKKPQLSAAEERIRNELNQIMTGQSVEELPFYAGFFNHGSLLDYFPEDGLIVIENPNQVTLSAQETDQRAQVLFKTKNAREEIPTDFPSSHFTWKQICSSIKRPYTLELDQWNTEQMSDLGFSSPPLYRGQFDSYSKDLERLLIDGNRVVTISSHKNRVLELLRSHDIFAADLDETGLLPPPSSVQVAQGIVDEGFRLSLPDGILLVLSDREVFGIAKRRRTLKHQTFHKPFPSADLEIGTYLVHIDHGIGRFTGTIQMAKDQGEGEYVILEYAEEDKLYIPTDQLNRIAPYVAPGDAPPKLTRLGNQEWVKIKAKAEASTLEMAKELLSIYASREALPGIAVAVDSPWQRELEDSFPFHETADQLHAIEEVKRDMERPHSMDRLVCGDVGYGKTEVALRAAFKSVMNGMQVAILVPTTILAQQHFVTFSERLRPFPVAVNQLSRLRTQAEQHNVLENLENGKIDIVIGTHRLLQKDVRFKNLGLVIIDEEQRFGVAHKEKMKQMRQEVDVLALSATPIPRTLHMCLAGVRDMSYMETPPDERLPIKTYVTEYGEDVVREAILRELDRGGQVFFLHNRIYNIHYVADQIRRIVPSAKVSIAHGRLPEESLAEEMSSFIKGKTDILVCTTIIESGLDIPNVNTLIINRADTLGLGQLYQLRGRIGRGSRRAYAYLMVPNDRSITETAEKRLKTILAATELGSGYRIAMSDLEIRGAGNLLGAEQSGHIHAVGFDLYNRLLAQAVEEIKTAQTKNVDHANVALTPNINTRITLSLPAHIPESYVQELPTRLSIYQRLLEVKDHEEANDIENELQDRFGSLPSPAQNLLYIARLKTIALQAELESVEQHGDKFILKLGNWIGVDRAAIQRTIGRAGRVGNLRITLDSNLMGHDWRQSLLMAIRRLQALRQELLTRVKFGAT